MKVQIREVKSKLSRYGDLAHAGERIVVTKNGKAWFELVPVQKRKRNVKPLKGVQPSIGPREATAPVGNSDIAGWT